MIRIPNDDLVPLSLLKGFEDAALATSVATGRPPKLCYPAISKPVYSAPVNYIKQSRQITQEFILVGGKVDSFKLFMNENDITNSEVVPVNAADNSEYMNTL